MDRLIQGYHEFRHSLWPERRAMFERLARTGQSPQTMVIACSDSRVDPTMIFNAQPGELFVLRNVANLVPPYEPDAAFHSTSAALEFAVRVLKVRNLIVMGHAMCGGIQVLLDESAAPAGDFLVPWMRIAEPARRRVLERAPPDPQAECERESVRLSLERLHTFPWIDAPAQAGALQLGGAIFDIRSGLLQTLRPDGSFEPV